MDWSIIATFIGSLAALVGALVLWNLRLLREEMRKFSVRVEKNETSIEKLQNTFSARRIDCDREFATKEEYVRSESYTRAKLDQVLSTVARMEGALKISAKMPEIIGQVVREIVRELQIGDKING